MNYLLIDTIEGIKYSCSTLNALAYKLQELYDKYSNCYNGKCYARCVQVSDYEYNIIRN